MSGPRFHYVIVGAGSAGCVLANRLSADPSVRVLLLEAGGDDRSWVIQAPGGFLPIMHQGWFSWIYQTVPQRHAGDRILVSPRGKVIGGSSSINGMTYDRGVREDYDAWAGLGNEGWSYADVLPYFKRLERWEPGTSPYHGADGPVRVTRPGICHPLAKAFVEASLQAGYPFNADSHGETREGVTASDATAAAGRRFSASRSYLRPVLSRANLRILTRAHVTRIAVSGGRAVGVEYVWKGEKVLVRAEQEVLISAGAIASPQLLMLSGIGNPDHLREHGLAVVQALRGVGQNYRDHLAVAVKQTCKQPISLYNFFNPLSVAKATLQFALFKSGPLSNPVMETVAYLRTLPGSTTPDIKIHFLAALYEAQEKRIVRQHGFFAYVDILQPDSVGELKLRSSDPYAPPVIDPNILATEHDMGLARSAIRAVRGIFMQPAFAAYAGSEIAPGDKVLSDSELDGYIRATATPDIHTVGTCRMGHDPMAVVDPQLRVHGIDGLRVVDASVMPRVPRGNTNIPVMMVAERAADLILGRTRPSPASA